MSEHNLKGNCWDDRVSRFQDGQLKGELNDVCGDHDEPRGDCSVCPDCSACEDDISARIFPEKYS